MGDDDVEGKVSGSL